MHNGDYCMKFKKVVKTNIGTLEILLYKIWFVKNRAKCLRGSKRKGKTGAAASKTIIPVVEY